MIKSTVVVILLALTLAAFSMLLAPSVRADISEAKVVSYKWYVSPDNTALAEYTGDLVAVGEIQNVGSNVIGYAAVGGIVYDSTGSLLASNEAAIHLNGLLPGQKVPFYLDFPPESSVSQDLSWVSSAANVTVQVTYVSDTAVPPYSGLTLGASTSYVDSNSTFTVIGIVQNNGSETTGDVFVVTTFYDASGSVLGMNFSDSLSNSLAPGGTVQFTATPTDNTAQLTGEIANYSMLIQSVPQTTSALPSPSGSSPSPFESSSSLPTSSLTVAPSSSVQPSQTSQPSSSSLLIYAIVGSVAIVVVVVAALVLLRKRR